MNIEFMNLIKAEIMSIGDEIVTGQRLDTNTQWLSHALGELGVPVQFHSTVGDDLSDHVSAIQTAVERSSLLILTGGLGPTADDLTRTAIAQAANVELVFQQNVLDHIANMYQRHGREMPPSNRAQAYFPTDSQIIPNPEGTAPGIDLTVQRSAATDRSGVRQNSPENATSSNPNAPHVSESSQCRIFALPGVPVEMKQMWAATVAPALIQWLNLDQTFHHHTLHCFGLGESTIETMLTGMIERGRDPLVGITASAATISLRVSTRAATKSACLQKMIPTIQQIRATLAELIFGEEGETLEAVVLKQLADQKLTLAIADGGLGGDVASRLAHHGWGGQQITEQINDSVIETARAIKEEFKSDLGIAIGPLDFDELNIAAGTSHFEVAIVGPDREQQEIFRFGGHSGWRRDRAVKQVLNFVRLFLANSNSLTEGKRRNRENG
jgi:nicotinamide-nucleotide amidase